MADSGVPPPRSAGVLHLTQFRGAALLLMASVFASRFIGYLRDAYIAWAFGVGRNTDAYLIAFRLPDTLNYLVAGATLSITLIPILHTLHEKNEEDTAFRVFSSVATFMGILLTIGTILGYWFAPYLLHKFFPEFTADEFQQCLLMTRIVMPNTTFFCLGALLSAHLYTEGRFLIPALTPLIYNTCILLGGIFLGWRFGVVGLAIGSAVGAFLGFFFIPLIATLRRGLRYKPYLDLSDPYFKKWLRTTLPLMIGVSVVTLDDWFIGYFAAGTVGAITLLNNAKQLTRVPIAVLGQAIGQAAMPFFSKLASQNNWDVFRETVDRSVGRTVAGGILAISLLEALTLPAARLVYERGRYSDANAHLTATYFAIFMLTLTCWIAQGIYARAFYATGDTLAPMVQSTIVAIATLPVYWSLLHGFGVSGLAWASDVAIVVQTITLGWLLRRRGLLQMDPRRWSEIGRVAAAGFIAWAAAFSVYQWIEPAEYHWIPEVGAVACVSLTWLAAAIALTHLLRLEEVKGEAKSTLKKLRLVS